MSKAASPIPSGYHSITPQLTLDRAAEGMEWYKKALGAQEIARNLGPDGKVMHAELKIGNSHFMVSDVMPGGKGPTQLGGSPAGFWIYSADADGAYNRAVKEGAKVEMAIADQFWGDRAGAVRDPHGYTWWFATRKEDLSKPELETRADEFFKQAAHASR
jgi:PhnB protein